MGEPSAVFRRLRGMVAWRPAEPSHCACMQTTWRTQRESASKARLARTRHIVKIIGITKRRQEASCLRGHRERGGARLTLLVVVEARGVAKLLVDDVDGGHQLLCRAAQHERARRVNRHQM